MVHENIEKALDIMIETIHKSDPSIINYVNKRVDFTRPVLKAVNCLNVHTLYSQEEQKDMMDKFKMEYVEYLTEPIFNAKNGFVEGFTVHNTVAEDETGKYSGFDTLDTVVFSPEQEKRLLKAVDYMKERFPMLAKYDGTEKLTTAVAVFTGDTTIRQPDGSYEYASHVLENQGLHVKDIREDERLSFAGKAEKLLKEMDVRENVPESVRNILSSIEDNKALKIPSNFPTKDLYNKFGRDDR